MIIFQFNLMMKMIIKSFIPVLIAIWYLKTISLLQLFYNYDIYDQHSIVSNMILNFYPISSKIWLELLNQKFNCFFNNSSHKNITSNSKYRIQDFNKKAVMTLERDTELRPSRKGCAVSFIYTLLYGGVHTLNASYILG